MNKPIITREEPIYTTQVDGCRRKEASCGSTGTCFFGGKTRGRMMRLATSKEAH